MADRATTERDDASRARRSETKDRPRVAAGDVSAASAVLQLQRSAGNQAVAAALEEVRRSSLEDGSGPDGGEVDPALEQRILAQRSAGQPLEPDVRRRMEGAFDTDFSGVRVSTSTVARDVGARAFTVGSDIVFDEGQLAPGTAGGDHVLAHELAHVEQSAGRAQRQPVRRDLYSDWKPNSTITGRFGQTLPRSKALKRVDDAVVEYLASIAGSTETQLAKLQGIQRAISAWGKEDTSKRSGAVQALLQETAARIATLESTLAPPTDVAPEPADEVEAPTDVVEAPTDEVEAPTDVVEAPTDEVEAPTDVVAAPTDTVEAPTDEVEAPTDVVAAPTDEVEAPTDAVIAPTDEVEAPTDVEHGPAPEPDDAKAARYKAHVLGGGDHTGLSVTQAEMLDVLQAQLDGPGFAEVAATLMLNIPASVVEAGPTRTEALRILQVLFADKGIARRLLDQGTSIVVIPRNKKMTDLVEFSSLAGTRTFDGRPWEDVRGSGGFKVPGVNAIYVAVSEENITGEDAEGPAAGTSWCYDAGYSTTSHETAHVIDIYGLETADRAEVDRLYAAKVTAEATTPQEWIDGYNIETGPHKGNDVYAAWQTRLSGNAEEADLVYRAYYLFAAPTTFTSTPDHGTWLPKLQTAGMVSSDGLKTLMPDGTEVGTIAADPAKTVGFHGGSPKTVKQCYAASHRLEYFAQTANAYLGSNGGPDPYVGDAWAKQGQPAKGKRRNGKAEARRIEPDLCAIFDRIFGAGAELPGTNDRS
jgi:hypothetical protein